MNSSHLSKRLAEVANHVEVGSRLADIGSDHAYLPIYLAKNRIISYGIASEVAKGPMSNAVTEIRKENLLGILHPRLADGLAAIQGPDEINVITICGMGGSLISKILEEGKRKLSGKEKLVLQPNVGEHLVRNWLMLNSYQIMAEQILEEDGHIYEIITAKKSSQPVNYSNKQLQFGPFLMKEKSAVFIRKWQEELQSKKRVFNQISRSNRDESTKLNKIAEEIKMIEEVLKGEG